MNSHYHVVTPFSRFQNLSEFLQHLRSFEITWHPILDDDLSADQRALIPDEPWIKPIFAPARIPGWLPVYSKQNFFADNYRMEEAELGHRFQLLNDDDFLTPNFFEAVDNHPGDVLICSMERGTDSFLLAEAASLKMSCVGNEQLLTTGAILRDPAWRFGPHYEGDWDYIQKVTACHPPVYVPNAVVLFNWLEPGRYADAAPQWRHH